MNLLERERWGVGLEKGYITTNDERPEGALILHPNDEET